MTREVSVPLARLAVLDEEELFLGGCVEAVTDIALVERLHRVDAFLVNEAWRGESQSIALIQAVTHGVAAVVIAAAARHDGPFTRIAALAAAAAIIGVIEVGQAQHVSELVAEGADAVHVRPVAFPTGNLGGAGIQTEPHIIQPGR